MEPTQSSETLAYKIQTPGKFQEDNILKLDLHLMKNLVKCYLWSVGFLGLKFGHFDEKIRNNWKVLKCGFGEGWRRPVGPIV
jgi:hypothetical protein